MCAQVIVEDYMKSETVLKASRMHDELDLDGGRRSFSPALAAHPPPILLPRNPSSPSC